MLKNSFLHLEYLIFGILFQIILYIVQFIITKLKVFDLPDFFGGMLGNESKLFFSFSNYISIHVLCVLCYVQQRKYLI